MQHMCTIMFNLWWMTLVECDTQRPLGSWDILSNSNFSIDHIPLKIMQRPHSESRLEEISSSIFYKSVFTLEPNVWSSRTDIWKGPNGDWGVSENICCCRRWQLQNPRWDLLSWGQEGSYAIDRRRTIYSNISSSGRVLYAIGEPYTPHIYHQRLPSQPVRGWMVEYIYRLVNMYESSDKRCKGPLNHRLSGFMNKDWGWGDHFTATEIYCFASINRKDPVRSINQ